MDELANLRAAQLTGAEREVLRLWDRLETKEIARELGISPAAVHERLRSARRRLGVSSSKEAAQALAAVELSHHAYTRHVDTPPRLADAPVPTLSSGDRRTPTMREEQRPYGTSVLLAGPSILREGKRNDLTSTQRLMWIVGLAAAIPLVLGSLMMGLWGLAQIVMQIRRLF